MTLLVSLTQGKVSRAAGPLALLSWTNVGKDAALNPKAKLLTMEGIRQLRSGLTRLIDGERCVQLVHGYVEAGRGVAR